jgi:hypothetical protein
VLTTFLNDTAINQLAPQTWRNSKVVPLYKGEGDKCDFNNYRSIAVSPPFTKLLMSILNQRLTKEADAQEILAPTQAGFRKHYTTIEQALTVQ